MKRKVLCIFSFLLILLVFCTLISPKAEEEMRTLVEAKQTTLANSGRNINIGKIAITWEHSNDILFNIIEGEGWTSGLQIAEIPSTYFTQGQGHITLGPGTDYWYIFSASREPVSGGAVTPVEETWKGDDTYLLWSADTMETLGKLSNNMEVLEQSENAALISVWSATFPFFEHRIWYSLRERTEQSLRVYSLHDVQQFLDALPWISGVAAVLLCSLILWGASWILPDKARGRKGMLWLNTLLIAGLFAALPWLLSQFDLPASLMPKEFILDISHYVQTFERIFTSLDSMGSPIMRDAAEQATIASITVVGLGVLFTAAIAAIEGFVCHRRSKEELTSLE